MTVILSTPTSTLLNEIESSEFTQNDIARSYAIALRDRDMVDWAKVNHAIIARWSRSALVRIKTAAWYEYIEWAMTNAASGGKG